MSTDEPTNASTVPPGEAPGLVAPAKAVRLFGMLHGLAEELDGLPLDDRCRKSLVSSHRAALIETASGVSDALVDEMVRLHMAPLDPDATPDQIRVAEAQLLGWITGLIRAGGLVSGTPLDADPAQNKG